TRGAWPGGIPLRPAAPQGRCRGERSGQSNDHRRSTAIRSGVRGAISGSARPEAFPRGEPNVAPSALLGGPLVQASPGSGGSRLQLGSWTGGLPQSAGQRPVPSGNVSGGRVYADAVRETQRGSAPGYPAVGPGVFGDGLWPPRRASKGPGLPEPPARDREATAVDQGRRSGGVPA